MPSSTWTSFPRRRRNFAGSGAGRALLRAAPPPATGVDEERGRLPDDHSHARHTNGATNSPLARLERTASASASVSPGLPDRTVTRVRVSSRYRSHRTLPDGQPRYRIRVFMNGRQSEQETDLVDGVLYEVPRWAEQMPREERLRYHQGRTPPWHEEIESG